MASYALLRVQNSWSHACHEAGCMSDCCESDITSST